MTTVRENLVEALEGRTPRTTPLSIYDWNMDAVTSDELAARMREPAWKRLLERGLGVSHHCPLLDAVEEGVERTRKERREGEALLETESRTTPVGEIRKVTRDGWTVEHWIKTPEDYRICTWIAEHTRIDAHPERYAAAEAAVGEQGLVVVTGAGNWTHRSPAMQIAVDLAGAERFCLDLATGEPALMELYEARKALFLEEQRRLAQMPGRYVNWLENLTVALLGPTRYRDLLLSVYEEAAPILARGDKRILVHYDGCLSGIEDDIASAPFHGIDSLTEPPEGDLSYDTCRKAWPDKVFWGNINVALHAEPEEVLRRAVEGMRDRAGKRGLALQISEERPANWQESIPVVLETLAALD